MKLGIIGKPQSGKTTIFNAAACAKESVGDFSRAIHKAVIKVPDRRLLELAEIVKPKKITYAEVEFLDAPGFSGDSNVSGGLEIHPEIRQQDALILVLNAFSPDSKPETEIKNLTDEMILLDQVVLESNIEKRTKRLKISQDKLLEREVELLKRCVEHLDSGKPLLDLNLSEEEDRLIRGFMFLSRKPLLIVVNISENDISKAASIENDYAHLISPGKRELAVVCGKVEAELVLLAPEERAAFMTELGIESPAMEKVIRKSYELLGLVSFLTAGEPEVRAWTIKKGMNAQQAAGAIHSDIERGFIRAEVIDFADYVQLKTSSAIRAAGKLRLEGKEYVVQDGDVMLFRFNV
jgi:ribosome-binding ATPase